MLLFNNELLNNKTWCTYMPTPRWENNIIKISDRRRLNLGAVSVYALCVFFFFIYDDFFL